MTTSMQNFQRRIKGIATAKLLDSVTGNPFHIPNCNFVFNPGQAIEVLDLANAVGTMGYAGFTQTEDKPSLELTFKHNPPEVLEMTFGYKFMVENNYLGEYTKEFTIKPDGTVDGVAAGQLGETIVDDDPGVSISIIDDNFNYTLPLTRTTLAAGVTAATEFTVGATGALTFDSSLAGKNGTMTVTTTFAQALAKSEIPIGTYDIRSTLVLADSNRVALFEANNCEVQLGQSQFNPASPETSITVMPIADLGACSAYKFAFLETTLAC